MHRSTAEKRSTEVYNDAEIQQQKPAAGRLRSEEFLQDTQKTRLRLLFVSFYLQTRSHRAALSAEIWIRVQTPTETFL